LQLGLQDGKERYQRRAKTPFDVNFKRRKPFLARKNYRNIPNCEDDKEGANPLGFELKRCSFVPNWEDVE